VISATDIVDDLSKVSPKCTVARLERQNCQVRASMEATMSNSYWRIERLIVGAVDRRILEKPGAWDSVVSIVTESDLLVLTAICIVGLLLSLAVMLMVPGFAETTEALQQFL
jgi:hypothetical protein